VRNYFYIVVSGIIKKVNNR